MKNNLFLLVLLLLASLACSATTPRPQGGALVKEAETTLTPTPPATAPQGSKQTPTITPKPTPPATCKVTTGYPAGTVNLRACAGLACQVVAVLNEGDTLTVIKSRKG